MHLYICVYINKSIYRSLSIDSSSFGGLGISLLLAVLQVYKECAINPLHVISAYGYCKATLAFLSSFINGQDICITDIYVYMYNLFYVLVFVHLRDHLLSMFVYFSAAQQDDRDFDDFLS
jgi:hypothetical protein